jgi:mono/diheme cytochrome c family protein
MRFAAGFLFATALLAQPPAKTVLEGAYTAAQATRGEAAYQTSCAGCHGETLDGRAMGALRGEKFLDHWREDSLGLLFDHIKTRMPANAAGSLSANTYLDILAYILQQNGLPAGPQQLTAETVETFRLVGKDGPQPLASNTLVAVVGCFERGTGDTWILKSATEPARTANADQITSEEKAQAGKQRAGTREFLLSNLEDHRPGFRAETVRGKKVEAKGVLFRRTDRDRIHVLSLETAGDCEAGK